MKRLAAYSAAIGIIVRGSDLAGFLCWDWRQSMPPSHLRPLNEFQHNETNMITEPNNKIALLTGATDGMGRVVAPMPSVAPVIWWWCMGVILCCPASNATRGALLRVEGGVVRAD